MQLNNIIPTKLGVVQIAALAVAAIALVIGAFVDFTYFAHVYLVAFLFWVELSLGCLMLLMLPHLAGARWSFAIQRFAAAGARTIPLMAVLFIPVVFSLSFNYDWTEAGKGNLYLNGYAFFIRAIIYFAVWTWLAYTITDASYKNDEGSGDGQLVEKVHRTSIIGMILFFVTGTLAAVDWSLSQDPKVFFSIWGWLSISRGVLAAFALTIFLVLGHYWRENAGLKGLIDNRVVMDLGTILLTGLLVWIYMSFMQYIVIWSGNVPSKALWYAERTANNWNGYAFFIVVFHAIPLLGLLAPGSKRNKAMLVLAAAWLFIMRLVDMYWVIMPHYTEQFSVRLWGLILPVALGGVWFVWFFWNLNNYPLLPSNDPNLQHAIDHAHGHGEEQYETA